MTTHAAPAEKSKRVKALFANEPPFVTRERRQAAEYLMRAPASLAVFKYGLNIVTAFDLDTVPVEGDRSGYFIDNPQGKAIALPLQEALQVYSAKIEQQFMKSIVLENALLATTIARLSTGVVIMLPPKTDCGTIHLRLNAQGSSGVSYSYILVVAQEGSSATIIEENGSSFQQQRNVLHSEVVEIVAKKNAQVKFGTVQKLIGGKMYAYRKAVVEANAQVEWLNSATGGQLVKDETHTDLIGEGAQARMFVMFFGRGDQQFDFLGRCNHLARNTQSLMVSRGALKGKSKAIQQSLAKIGAMAFNASAHQKSKILLLDEGTKAVPIPKLEIDTNEVSATHEAAVGQIDDEKLFYLMSRGIPKPQAEKIIVEGFFEPHIVMIDVQELQNDMRQSIAKQWEVHDDA